MNARHIIRLGVCLLAVALVLSSPRHARAAGTKIVAALIGANDPGPNGHLKPLSYADDDALQAYELFTSLGVEENNLFLLVKPNDEPIHPRWKGKTDTQPVTKGALTATLGSALQRVSELKQAGFSVELFIWFSGHGGPARGANGAPGFTDGALYVSDGDFTTHELYTQVLRPSAADYIHLIIDACQAGSFVNRRGPGQRYAAHQASFTIPALPRRNVGYAVAASGNNDAREWAKYQGGVFSLMVRSGLRGAADVNNDGRVTYPELRAYIETANEGVQHAKAKLVPEIIGPPINDEKPLVTWTYQQNPTVVVDRFVVGRISFEDPEGVRLIEAHKTDEQGLVLRLPWRERYFATYEEPHHIGLPVPYEARRYEFQLGERQTKVFSQESPDRRPPRVAERGSEADALKQGLFRIPFGARAYEQSCRRGRPSSAACQVQSSNPIDALDQPVSDNYLGLRSEGLIAPWIFGAAVIAAGNGVVFRLLSESSYHEYRAATNPAEERRLKSRTQTQDWVTTISFGVAIGAALAGTVLLVYELGDSSNAPSLALGPESIELGVSF